MCSLSIANETGQSISVSSSFLNLNIKIIMILVGTKGLIWRGSV